MTPPIIAHKVNKETLRRDAENPCLSGLTQRKMGESFCSMGSGRRMSPDGYYENTVRNRYGI